MEKFVIVIGRQYGAGGRRFGKLLAQKLGVSYYDKELLGAAAEQSGFSKEIFAKQDEKRPSVLRSMLSFSYGSTSGSYNPHTLSGENIYRAQSDIIRNICSRESCVIVGRTADYVMRHHPNLISIFIHAPEQQRIKSIIQRGEASNERETLEIIKKKDRERESYYNYYTGRNWGAASNYDICLDSSKIPMERMADLVVEILENTKN